MTAAEKTRTGLWNLFPTTGARQRRLLLGRGRSSGHGKTSSRGGKGQSARTGSSKRPGFEGGQNPFLRRIPKRGFSNRAFQVRYGVLNVSDLDGVFSAGDAVSRDVLRRRGLIGKNQPVKILAGGELKKPLKIVVDAFSQDAKKKVEAAGGTIALSEKSSRTAC
ncbi:MAG: 50S ribosomal protein L15 [Elusimicrobia bacterium]|nr:50S ribosomal protein L15 [Elusimicrobiota bacterium]